MINKESALSRW